MFYALLAQGAKNIYHFSGSVSLENMLELVYFIILYYKSNKIVCICWFKL
jgi:hypothetical protein